MRAFIAEDQFLLRRGLEELMATGASNARRVQAVLTFLGH